ncbi:MalY/PatB family protein [Spiroplasma chrysopicola]|uniref:cysteine-S-conjugate beta-lyase n=1 Tax=Spiroplasma chrysopicola DF-1 TaxID=1276227 RepID=R4U1A8_9MOLU|nr:aminotransferase class I/II-fold pyridoxal phosphate-dependent enzyme [Spiroplasma chrysopicola]AGM25117.1 cystathione beta-lyase [Spiroplasma chrysopicola DF-1]
MHFHSCRKIDQKRWNHNEIITKYNISPEDAIGLWIADSDLPLPRKIVRGIVKRAKYPYYGYQILRKDFAENLLLWHQKTKDVELSLSNFFFTPSTVFTVATIIEALTTFKDKILICTPIYEPLFHTIEVLDRKPVVVPLIVEQNQITFDFVALRAKIKAEKPRAFVVCSPLNPGGRIWTKEEMSEIVKICKENSIILISDEIHGDIILYQNQFISFLKFWEEYDNIIVASSINKTFNLAGIHNGWGIVKSPADQAKIATILDQRHISSSPNIFAQAACISCFKYGQKYLQTSKKIYQQNLEYIIKNFKEQCPELVPIIPEGTFLCCVNFANTGISRLEMVNLLIKDIKVLPQFADDFVDSCHSFFRLNLAIKPRVMVDVCQRIIKIVNQFKKTEGEIINEK